MPKLPLAKHHDVVKGNLAGLIRSAALHNRSAKATVAQSADLVSLSPAAG
jgi:hypothetical protein